MATGYVRQSAGVIVTAATIQASHFNNEFNVIEDAFDATTGHNHDGTVGGGAPLVPTALSGLSSNGMVARTSATAFAARTITGTADKITITNGDGVSGNPTITIASTYVGQSTITTLGTITTGVWNGSVISATYGGTGLSSLGSGIATWLGTPSSANLASAITDETGSGALVFANTPTLVTPILGTPTSGTLTNCTGLPVSTGISGLGANVATFLATPSSANLAAALTDETGTGANVFANTPTLVTPILGTPTSGTLTNCTGLPVSTGISGLGAGIATFLATPSSANLRSAVTDESGTGALLFAGGALGTPASGTGTNLTGIPMSGLVSGTLASGVGAVATSGSLGTVSSGTVTPLATTNGNFNHYTNNGAHTLAPPAGVCTMVIEITNGASAGTITTSSYTKVTGDAFTTTNAHRFMCYITKGNTGSILNVVAQQ